MHTQKCFDNEKYLKLQKDKILKKAKEFDNKLYIEFGGKLFDDYHAARVLPGFDKNVQVTILQDLKDSCELIMCICAEDIDKSKIRADFGITYDLEMLRQIDNYRKLGIQVSAVVITMFNNQAKAIKLKEQLEAKGETVYYHYFTKGYPSDVATIVSEEGYGKNPFIKTSKPIVVVTAPGPKSGKLATCLSQLFHEYKNGVRAGFVKFEKFPVWDLTLKDPINMAYEAATAELNDTIMLDSYHYDAYNKMAVTYNREMQSFPIIHEILKKITQADAIKSPTDMGINSISQCIFDKALADYSAKQEIVRRYFKAKAEYKKGNADKETVERIKILMTQLYLSEYDRKCVKFAEQKEEKSGCPSIAIELNDGTIIMGRKTKLLSASASVTLNALKHLAKINDDIDLIPNHLLEPIKNLKENILNSENALSLKDVLMALSIYATENDLAKSALSKINQLKRCQGHSTHILSGHSETTFRKLKITITCGDKVQNDSLYNEDY